MSINSKEESKIPEQSKEMDSDNMDFGFKMKECMDANDHRCSSLDMDNNNGSLNIKINKLEKECEKSNKQRSVELVKNNLDVPKPKIKLGKYKIKSRSSERDIPFQEDD